ncbi:hypothetical protein EDD21DRAFT_390158, partial [Dissophora ornata]
MRCNNAITWAVVARLYRERTGIATVEWVRGHAGNEWNEKADTAAKQGHLEGDPWKVDPSAQEDFRYSAEMAGEML